MKRDMKSVLEIRARGLFVEANANLARRLATSQRQSWGDGFRLTCDLSNSGPLVTIPQ